MGDGPYGEACAEAWLVENEWEYIGIPQEYGTKCYALWLQDGKRPDFITHLDDVSGVALDAKYHRVAGGRFGLTDYEIGQYHGLLRDLKFKDPDRVYTLLFMVFPKVDEGKRFAWVEISEVEAGEPVTIEGKPGRSIDLYGNGRVWSELSDAALEAARTLVKFPT